MPSRWQASPRSARGVPCPLSPPRLPPREEVPSAFCCSPVPPPFSLPVPEGLPGGVLLRRGTQAQTQARLPWLWDHQTRLPWVPSLFSASLCLPCQLSISSFGGLIGGELPAWSPTTTPALCHPLPPQRPEGLDRLGLWPQIRGTRPTLDLGCQAVVIPGCRLLTVLLTAPVDMLTPPTAQLGLKGGLVWDLLCWTLSLLKRKVNGFYINNM